MAILRHDAFQPPLPSLLFLVPPGSNYQWPLRILLLLWTTFFSLPLFAILVPISVILSTTPHAAWAPLPLHPDNLPPHMSTLTAIGRGIWMYYLSASVWAITCLGNAPDTMGPGASKKVAEWCMKTTMRIDDWAGYGHGEELELREERIGRLEERYRVGVMKESGMRDEEISGFWLTRAPAPPSNHHKDQGETKGGEPKRRIYLFLSGGGYVTGAPIAHPFLFALTRHFPLAQGSPNAPEYGIFAPNVHHSLSLDRAFPVPLLDALAAYAHLRAKGYRPDEITVMGDSAGAGLVWSLVSYLAILHSIGSGELGIPGGMICCSPWWSLPPIPPSAVPQYPDLLDTPQLLQAARCYLGRYPLLKHRPNPFESDWSLWAEWVGQTLKATEQRVFSLVLSAVVGTPRRKPAPGERRLANAEANMLLQPEEVVKKPKRLVDWLNHEMFVQMTSHHPLISPATNPASPFVTSVLDVLAREKTRVLIHAGTAEWFHDSSVEMYQSMKLSGVDVTFHSEVGGYHSEPAYMPVGVWGSGRRWLECLEKWQAAT